MTIATELVTVDPAGSVCRCRRPRCGALREIAILAGIGRVDREILVFDTGDRACLGRATNQRAGLVITAAFVLGRAAHAVAAVPILIFATHQPIAWAPIGFAEMRSAAFAFVVGIFRTSGDPFSVDQARLRALRIVEHGTPLGRKCDVTELTEVVGIDLTMRIEDALDDAAGRQARRLARPVTALD